MSAERVGGSGTVLRHKSSHAAGGTDALSAADIGAASQASLDQLQLLTLMGAWA